MSDNERKSIDLLWSSFLNGDDKGFSVIYQLHINRLLSYGYKLCPDREWVHDSIQEVFLDLFLRRKKQDRHIKNLKAWLFVAIRNSLVKKMVKSRKFEPIVTDGEQEFIFFNTEYTIQEQLIDFEGSGELKEKLNAAVNNLPPKQKEIIYLKFEEELDYPEISAIMEISIESARKLMYRALLSLRKIVDPQIVMVFFLNSGKKIKNHVHVLSS